MYILLSIGVIAFVGFVEYLMGHILICKCGYIKLWQSQIFSSENSQHISDWYSFSHIIHGFAFYYLAKWLFPKKSAGFWFLIAVLIESGWELIENSPFVINRYREGGISLDYYGDSVLNSVMDIIFMVLGFWLAARLPVWLIVSLIILMELGVLFFIRDNLTLNIIMLLYPFDGIKQWQVGQ